MQHVKWTAFKKPWALVFLLKRVATTIYFFFILQLFFGRGSQRLQKTVSVALQFNPQLYPWELDNVGSVRIQVCIDIVRMWGLGFLNDQNMVEEANTKIGRRFSWESWCSDVSRRVFEYLFNFAAMLSFCFQLRTTADDWPAPLLLQTFVEVVT